MTPHPERDKHVGLEPRRRDPAGLVRANGVVEQGVAGHVRPRMTSEHPLQGGHRVDQNLFLLHEVRRGQVVDGRQVAVGEGEELGPRHSGQVLHPQRKEIAQGGQVAVGEGEELGPGHRGQVLHPNLHQLLDAALHRRLVVGRRPPTGAGLRYAGGLGHGRPPRCVCGVGTGAPSHQSDSGATVRRCASAAVPPRVCRTAAGTGRRRARGGAAASGRNARPRRWVGGVMPIMDTGRRSRQGRSSLPS